MEPEQGVGGFSCRQSRRSDTDTATANATVPVHVPRTIRQHALELIRLRDRTPHRGDRWPDLTDLVASMGISPDQATRAIQAAESHRALSLDVPADDQDATPLGALLPEPEPDVEPEDLLVLPELVAALPAAERTAVWMHYLQGRMQHEIAAVLGCSQMTVSRLLRQALERLRAELVDSDPVPGSP